MLAHMRCRVKKTLAVKKEDNSFVTIKDCCNQDACCDSCDYEDCHEGCFIFDNHESCKDCIYYECEN